MDQYILSIDQGTTSTRALIISKEAKIISHFQTAHAQHYPHSAWVEHDPEEIWNNVLLCCNNALQQAKLGASDISCMGITNQRETTIAWDKSSGKPIYPAIVWQDRRTMEFCDRLKEDGKEVLISHKTGLLADPYFSAGKLNWILDNVPVAKTLAAKNQLAFGTIDTFLIWRFTRGRVHATDITNASRTSLYNFNTHEWDPELCRLFQIPMQVLPEVRACDAGFGKVDASFLGAEIPITGVAGDQQAAAIGQCCFSAGDIKTTYGTGCFMLMNVGEQPKISAQQLLTTVLYKLKGQVNYALEGSIFIAGAGIKWLRDQMGLIQDASESETMAAGLKDNGGVYFVPALAGLGAPWWRPGARGLICGMSLDTRKEHIVRAMLESLGYQTLDLLKAMQKDAGMHIESMRVDGGMVANQWLMQWLADILQMPVKKNDRTEITVLGAGMIAALGAGIFSDLSELQSICRTDSIFVPSMGQNEVDYLYGQWLLAVGRV